MPAYISELAYAAGTVSDFVEVAVEAGTDMSGYCVCVYNSAGTVTNMYTFGTAVNTVAGNDVYVIDDATAGFTSLGTSEAVALVDDLGNTLQFVSWSGYTATATDGPAVGLTSTDIGTATGTSSLETSYRGDSYYTQTSSSEGTIPCYAPGTMIDTPDGPRPVEGLSAGDMVTTRDHGPRAIRWIRHSDTSLDQVDPARKPVQIKAGARGPGRPVRDLIVSPQHRILLGAADQMATAHQGEVFAPAKALTGLPGLRHMKGKQRITWVHFACDRHEVVSANGCWSESLLLGPVVMRGLTTDERSALTRIFGPAPESGAAWNGPPARHCLTVGETTKLAARYRKRQRKVAATLRDWDRDRAMEQFEAEQFRAAS